MPPLNRRQVSWARRWMTLVLLGLFVFMLGINPGMIGMDYSPVVGFVQIGVWLTGLALLLLGATLTGRGVRPSFADFRGTGPHRLPDIYFGPLQVFGLALGVVVSLLGVILYWPSRARRREGTAPASPMPAHSPSPSSDS